MKILLNQSVDTLGKSGEIVNVKNGYARNYLIPRKMAVLATDKNIKAAHVLAEKRENREAKRRENMTALAERLNKLTIKFTLKAGEDEKLFGSVTSQMIADAIESTTGEKIDRRNVIAPPIRELGIVEVPIRLTADLIPSVKVVVYQEGESSDTQEADVIGYDESEIEIDMSPSDVDDSSEAELIDKTDSEDLDNIPE